MSSFSIGLSALTVSQRALDIIGQNIANADTPGYHRQVVNLASRFPTERAGFSFGTGVEITDIRRLRNQLLESAITRNLFETADTTTQLEIMRQIETMLFTGEGTVHNQLELFFNQLEQLAARPDDVALRRILLGTASALSSQFNVLAGDFDRMRENLDQQVAIQIEEINALTRQIAQLNEVIQRAEIRGIDANDPRDQRDQLINELAERVGLQAVEQDFGQVTVLVGGVPLVVSNESLELESTTDAAGNRIVRLVGTTDPLALSGGRLGGMLEMRNNFLPSFRSRLDTLARELVRQLDRVHATGIGLSGPLTRLFGHRAVSDATVPLNSAEPTFPIQSGSLFVTVTDLSSGSRTLAEIAIDPATQSLQDVAAAISAVGNVQALVDLQTNTLRILAAPGYGFDFAGRLQPSPDTSLITGSTVPSISGVYTGGDNDRFTFRVVGSGTIGVTAGLTLEVEDALGGLITSLNIGQGYEPGSALLVADGVRIQLASGTANDGDTFTTQVVAEPDSSGLLAALGLNTFFEGANAGEIAVSRDLLGSPERLSASQTGAVGDGAIVRRMAQLRDAPLLGDAADTFREFYAAMIGDAGTRVGELSQLQSHQEVVGARLEAEQQSVSGVDPNEELVKMLQFQRSFQMAARYITVVNETLDELFQLI